MIDVIPRGGLRMPGGSGCPEAVLGPTVREKDFFVPKHSGACMIQNRSASRPRTG